MLQVLAAFFLMLFADVERSRPWAALVTFETGLDDRMPHILAGYSIGFAKSVYVVGVLALAGFAQNVPYCCLFSFR